MGKDEKKLLYAALFLGFILVVGGLVKTDALKKEKIEQEQKKLFQLAFGDIFHIKVENQHGIQEIIKKDDKQQYPLSLTYRDSEFQTPYQWYYEDEIPRYVNIAMVDTMIHSLQQVEIQKVIAEGDHLKAQYGLDTPQFTLELKDPTQNVRYLFGDLNSAQTGRYLYDEQKNQVVLIGLNLDYLADRDQYAWSEKSIVKTNLTHLASIKIGNGKIALIRNGDEWAIQDKILLKVDMGEMQKWVRSLNAMQAQEIKVRSSKPTNAKEIELIKEDGTSLQLWVQEEKDHALVYRSDDQLQYKIKKEDVEKILVAQMQMMEKNFSIPDLQALKSISIAFGKKNFSFEKNGEWKASEPFVDSLHQPRFESMMDMFDKIKVDKFISNIKPSTKSEFTLIYTDLTNQKHELHIYKDKIWTEKPQPMLVSAEIKDWLKEMDFYLSDVRKRDLYPLDIDAVEKVVLLSVENKIVITRRDDQDWKVQEGDVPNDPYFVFSIVNLIEETKIQEWISHDLFQRQGDAEIHITSLSGLEYTWQLGQIENNRQLVFCPEKSIAGWVDASKIDLLLNKLTKEEQ